MKKRDALQRNPSERRARPVQISRGATRPYLEFSNLSMSSPTFWASFCGCLSPAPGGAPAGLGLGGGGGAGRGLEGAGGILFGFLSCPRASRCTGLGGTAVGGRDRTHNSGDAMAEEKCDWVQAPRKCTPSGDAQEAEGEKLHGGEAAGCLALPRLAENEKQSAQNTKAKRGHGGGSDTVNRGRGRAASASSAVLLPHFRTGC